MKHSERISKGYVSSVVFSRINRSFLKTLMHDVLFRNELALKTMWGLRVPPLFRSLPYGQNYGDLTTLLLRWTLSRWIRTKRLSRVHEIGIGHYGILCMYLKKTFPSLTVSGSTISADEVENASETAALNRLTIDYYVSDVLASLKGTVEMIWWNLPYYDPEVLNYLRRLRDQARDNAALIDGGLVVLGFNSVPLDADSVKAVFDACDHFTVKQVEKYVWNAHVLLTLEYVAASPVASKPGDVAKGVAIAS